MKAWAKQHHDWLLVEEDECWFSRFTQPAMYSFAEVNDNLRLVQRTPSHNEPDQALACYGAVCQRSRQRWLAFAKGQPNSDKTIQFASFAAGRQISSQAGAGYHLGPRFLAQK